jgi:hypothetical protein
MDIDTALNKWNNAKNELTILENNIERYKKSIDKYMIKKNKTKVIGKNFTVEKRTNTRSSLSKSNVPLEIWDRYSTRCTYNSYYLKKN